MQSGKADIKSKKAKLGEKKQQKQKIIAKPIEISSEEEEQLPLPIQKRRSSQKNINQTPKHFNVFNIDRLKKIEIQPSLVLNGQKELQVEENTRENPMHHVEARALFTYRIEGNDSTKYVSDLYLEQRVKKMAEEEVAKVAAGEKQEKEGEIEQGKEGEEEEEKKERSRPMRYFESVVDVEDEESRLIKCFRCGQKGHIAKNCIQEREQAKCLFCLGDHHHHDCNSRICFKCNEQGHISQQCRAIGMQCRKCSKKGHIEKNCGIIVFLDYSRIRSDQEFRDRYNGEDLKKLRCMAGCPEPNGHFNCHKYQKASKLNPYANYSRAQDPVQSFKNLTKYHSDFEPKRERQMDRHDKRSHQWKQDRGYGKQQSFSRGFERGYGYDRNQEGRASSKKKNEISYDRYNEKYNIPYNNYSINQHQRINDRYDYRTARW